MVKLYKMAKHYTHESEIEATLETELNGSDGEQEYLEAYDRNELRYETEW